MTDRYCAFTVILVKDMRSDDAEHVIKAIQMIKGVQDVHPLISDEFNHIAQERARRELGEKLWDILYPKNKG